MRLCDPEVSRFTGTTVELHFENETETAPAENRDVLRPESQSVSQSVISRSRPALTPPPARSPAPPLPVEHKYRVLAT